MAKPRLGPFELDSLLGRGGMADVFQGTHITQNTTVAIKVITAAYAREALFVQSFKNEVQAVARLNHPGIVMVFDHGAVPETTTVGEDGRLKSSSPYLVMEHASYGALDSVNTTLRWPALRALLFSLLDALAHAHARGVLHRDLKPGNILVSGRDGMRPGVKLTDFGIAHAMEREGVPSASEITGGTPIFMAPEQFDASWRDYGPWTDLYALGCLTYLYATGAPPFTADHPMSLAVNHLRKPPPRFVPEHPMPLELEAWAMRLLEKDPRDRFRQAADAAWALGQMVPPSDSRDEPPPEKSVLRMLSALDRPPPEPHEPADTIKPFDSSSLLSVHTYTLHWPEDDLDRETEKIEGTITDLDVHLPDEDEDEALLPFLDDTDEADAPSFLEPSRPRSIERVLPSLPSTWRRRSPQGPPVHLMGVGLNLYGLRSIPMVDRERERDAVWRTLNTIRNDGIARAVVLGGAAGTGKSRLAEWMSQRAAEVGSAIVLRAMHGPNGHPTEGLARMLARSLRCTDLPRGGVQERAEEVLRSMGCRDPFEWNSITELISPTPLDSSRSARFIHLPEGRERHAIILRFIERLTKERPVIVWLDDVHWSSDAIKFAQYVLDAQSRKRSPILLILTARDEQLAERSLETTLLNGLMTSSRAERLVVSPLKPDDHQRLVQELLGLNRQVAHLVAQRTAGNPLFAVQLVGDWVQRGLLTLGSSGFSLAAGESTEIPDGIHEVWSKRVELILERHDPDARISLEIAAVLGREVVYEEWEAVCRKAGVEAHADLIDDLDARRLVQSTELGFAFAHSMLRETVERFSREAGTFDQHHRRAAEMLYERFGSLTRGMAERIGRHYLQGGSYKEALSPLLRGATERFRQSEYLEALALLRDYERALTAIGARRADARWSDCWVLRARIATLQGNYDESIEWAERAEENAERWDLERVVAEAVKERALVAYHRGLPDTALELFRRAHRVFEKLGDDVGIAQCHIGMGDVRFRLGNLPGAADRYLDALTVIGPSLNAIESAAALWGLGFVAMWRGHHDRARRLFKRQQRIAERSGNRHGIARCLMGIADVARMEEDYASAERTYRHAIEIFEAIGSLEYHVGQLNLSLVLMARGNYDESRRLLDVVRPSMEGAHGRVQMCQVYALTLPGEAQAKAWRTFDEHLAVLTKLLQDTRLIDGDIAWTLGVAAHMAAESGEVNRALAAHRLAAPMWRTLGRDKEFAFTERAIAALDPDG